MLTCAIIDDYQGCALGLADWASLDGVQVRSFTDHIADLGALAAALAEFDIVVAMRERTRFDAATFAALPRLKLLVTSGMRNQAIDLAAAASRGIVVSGTAGSATAAPELAWGLLMALARHIAPDAASVRNGERWQTRLGIGLAGRTLGIVGLGSIGTCMARYARAFEMPVLAWSRNLTDERCRDAGAERAPDLDTLLRRADIVTLHVVLGDGTRGMLGARELALMKPTALLVNTSRGPLVDEAALVAALAEGRIAGAALDVFDVEPLPPGHPLRTLPTVLATPHIGYVTRESYLGYFQGAVEDIAAWQHGAPIRTL